MKVRIRYRDQEEVFDEIDPDFLGGLVAVPYLFFPESAQNLLKVDCFYNEDWQQYGSYDLIRGHIFPFIDWSSNRDLFVMIHGCKPPILETIYEGSSYRVVSKGISKRFVGTNDQFIKGLKHYKKKISPETSIRLVRGGD